METEGLGFPRSTPPVSPPAVARPTPLPKRPKGRWFIGVLLLAACGYGAYQVWDAFFRYRAYGTITGSVTQLSPPWDGVIAYFHVREGDSLRQGQLLMTLDNQELRNRYAQLGGRPASCPSDSRGGNGQAQMAGCISSRSFVQRDGALLRSARPIPQGTGQPGEAA